MPALRVLSLPASVFSLHQELLDCKRREPLRGKGFQSRRGRRDFAVGGVGETREAGPRELWSCLPFAIGHLPFANKARP
jgi:hypothetical protein